MLYTDTEKFCNNFTGNTYTSAGHEPILFLMGDLLQSFWPFAWVLIPLAGIGVGAFKEWLKFKDKQARLGASTHELEVEVEKLQKQLKLKDAEMQQRIQHLETIVTSQVWDTLHDESGMADEKLPPHLLDEIRSAEEDETDPARENRRKAAHLAKKIK